jgi:hypothetical protein
LVLVAAGCDDVRNPAAPPAELPSARISDGRFVGGNDDFFFLPPVMPDPRGTANYDAAGFNPRLGPTVSVCRLSANPLTNPTTDCALDAANKPILVASFSSSQVTVGTDQYHVNWNTEQSNLSVDLFYRLQVFLGSVRIGFADIDPMSNARELKNANTGEVIPLVDGRTLPVKFRIENGVLCSTKADCGEFKVTNSGGTFFSNTKDAGVQFKAGWLPAGVDEVTLRIERVTVGADNHCHGAAGARLWKEFEGCYDITTDPDLRPYGGIQQVAIAAQCVEVSPTDPLFEFLAPYKSNNGGELQRLVNAAQTFLDCEGFSGSAVSAQPSNPLMRYAAAGLRQLGAGFGKVFGVRTLNAIDLGLGEEIPIGSSFSRFSWAIGLAADVAGGEEQSVGFGLPVEDPLALHVNSLHFHSDPDGDHPDEVAGVPVRFTVTEGDGYFGLSESGAPIRSTDVPTNADGIASVNFTGASNSGTNIVTAAVTTFDPELALATFSIPGLAPDLVIENLTRSITSPNTSNPLSWTFGVRNIGLGAAVPSVVRVVVTLEEEGSEVIATYDLAVPRLTPGTTALLTTPVLAAPRDIGDHRVVTTADATSLVAESNEGNNTATEDFTVVAAPPAAPALLTPASGALISQNVQANGCSLLPASPRRGFGYQISFDWSDVSGATQYRLVAQHAGAPLPIVDVTVAQSQYSFVSCNSFAVDGNLAGWSWQVQTFANGVWGPLGAPRPFEFLPCRLPDGTACNIGEGPYPSPNYATVINFETLPGGAASSPTELTTQFSAAGLQFSTAQLFDAAVYQASGQNFGVWNQGAPNTYRMTLTSNPTDLTFELTGNNAVTFVLQAFSATGAPIPSGSIFRQSQVYAQPGTGTLFRRETIRILSASGVGWIDFNQAGCECGLILDNVRY